MARASVLRSKTLPQAEFISAEDDNAFGNPFWLDKMGNDAGDRIFGTK